MNRSTYYREMHRIRRVEEEIARLYPSDKIMSPIHLSIGQEPISVGVCQALVPDDVVFGTYRSHALYLAKGGDLRGMMAELFGKVTGTARGKGGSMHLIDVAHNVMGASAVVGTTLPQAVGYAYALKLKKKPNIVAVFFGEGATEEGVFYESLQFAALKKLPMVFICENNLYAIHSAWADRHAHVHLCDRVKGFGRKTVTKLKPYLAVSGSSTLSEDNELAGEVAMPAPSSSASKTARAATSPTAKR